ncbi:aldehyde dehydrogenase [Neobacillus sp. Marseille-QA0830]
MKKYGMYIGGKWDQSSNGEEILVLNPANESVIASVPRGGRLEAERAVEEANKAKSAWASMNILERASIIKRTAKRIEKNQEYLAKVIVQEQGKPIQEAIGEVQGAIFMLEYAANSALHIEGDILHSSFEDEQVLIFKVPHGVVLGITPWNYPLAVPARKIAPALITGNTVILKPHEETPISALELAKMFELEGLPKGVLNVVTGTGEEVGVPLVNNSGVDYITVTGSVRAGRNIYTSAAKNIIPVSLELGGKAPFIVLNDADVDLAVKHAVDSRMANCGQVCICNERTYIHEDIYDEFITKFEAELKNIQIGDPMDIRTQLGPKVNKTELTKIHNMVLKARDQGATIVTGGNPLQEGEFQRGYWYPPTLLTDVKQNMEIVQEEVFGPVIPVIKFSNFEEALEMANDSSFGLSAYLFTNDYKKIMKSVHHIDFGEIYINRSGPESFHAFHGGYRNSGVGGDDGKYGLDGYMKKKTVYMNYQ